MSEQKQDSGSVGSDVEKGIRSTASAVKSTAGLGKAVAKASAGDVAGAAKELLSDEKLRSAITVLVLFSFLLMILIFFAAPIALYEGVKSYCDTVRERWLESYYSSDSGRAISAIRATLRGAGAIAEDIWSSITSHITMNDVGKADSDELSEDDLTVFGSGQSLERVYSRKLDACVAKLRTRAQMIEDSIRASASGPISGTGTINGWVYNNLFLNRDSQIYSSLEDTRNVTYGGVSVITASQSMSRREAMKAIALYSSMYHQNIGLVKSYSLMKWLGYYDGSDCEAVSFTVGDTVNCSVKGWAGDFMPVYLIEEERENPEGDYSRFQCPAADILLCVSSSPLPSLTPLVEKTEIISSKWEERWGYQPQWRLMSPETYAEWGYYAGTQMPETWPDTDSDYGLWSAYRGSLSFEEMLKAYNSGLLGWYVVMDYGSFWEEVPVVEYDYTISYSMSASVSVRSVDALADLAGFYEQPDIRTEIKNEAA